MNLLDLDNDVLNIIGGYVKKDYGMHKPESQTAVGMLGFGLGRRGTRAGNGQNWHLLSMLRD